MKYCIYTFIDRFETASFVILSFRNDITVVQKFGIQILALGYHNRHIYMSFQFRYVASRKKMHPVGSEEREPMFHLVISTKF